MNSFGMSMTIHDTKKNNKIYEFHLIPLKTNHFNEMNHKIIPFILSVLLSGCGNNQDQSEAFGNFEAETRIISAEATGKIIQLHVENGQQVEKEFLAAVIDTIPLYLKTRQMEARRAAIQAKKQSVRAQIAIFEEQKKTLRINEKRALQMLTDGASTQKQLDDITGQINVIDKQIESTKTQFTSIERELDVEETQLAAIVDQLNRCRVYTPAAGTILETYAKEGELVTTGKPLFKTADLGILTLKVYVSGSQLPAIKLGQDVSVITDKNKTDNQSFTGKITWIAEEAEFTPKIIQTKEERVKLVYAVKVAVKNDGTLKMGMPGEVRWK